MLENSNLLRSQCYINGEWVDTENKDTFTVSNPYNGVLVGTCPDMGKEDCIKAIDAAEKAFHSWKKLPAHKRTRILQKWYSLIRANEKDLAKILTLEQGKPLAEALGEVRYGASYVEWFAEEARRVYGDVIPGHGSSKRITVIKQPIGVVGAITPWNFPSAMITRKVSPALAAGCTVVIKPSELTPLSALALAHLADEAGFPPGVLNIITTMDAPQIGTEITTNKKVRKVSFTGSTAVGKKLLAQSAQTIKKVSLELGGNAPFIVFEDADIDVAVNSVSSAKFRNAGQTCICPNRVFVHESIYDVFSKKLTKKLEHLTLGDGLDSKTNVGPLIEEKALKSVLSRIEDAESHGAKIVTGGKVQDNTQLILQPTLVRNVTEDMRLFKEEIFGPVLPLIKFKTEDEVIRMANDTEYGLASYFFGRDYARIWRVAEALEFGMVGINTAMIGTAVAPFGGIKESGFGREGSKYGIEDYLNIKYMCWDEIH